MPSLLPRTERAIADFQNLLSQHPHTDGAIQSYLTSHINVLMCAEIEQVVTRLVVERLAVGYHDEDTSNFFPNFLKERRISSIRNATVPEIRRTLAVFSPAYGEKFDGLLSQSVKDEDVQKLRVVVEKRNASAHGIPPSITFQELEETYQAATAVVAAVRQTLLP